MGVRPPSDDVEEEPDVIEFGIAALDARLEEVNVTFPTTAETLVAEYGDLTVPVDAAGTEITLESALDEIPTREFETEQELLDVLHPVFEQRRQRASRSVLSQLRALLPF